MAIRYRNEEVRRSTASHVAVRDELGLTPLKPLIHPWTSVVVALAERGAEVPKGLRRLAAQAEIASKSPTSGRLFEKADLDRKRYGLTQVAVAIEAGFDAFQSECAALVAEHTPVEEAVLVGRSSTLAQAKRIVCHLEAMRRMVEPTGLRRYLYSEPLPKRPLRDAIEAVLDSDAWDDWRKVHSWREVQQAYEALGTHASHEVELWRTWFNAIDLCNGNSGVGSGARVIEGNDEAFPTALRELNAVDFITPFNVAMARLKQAECADDAWWDRWLCFMEGHAVAFQERERGINQGILNELRQELDRMSIEDFAASALRDSCTQL